VISRAQVRLELHSLLTEGVPSAEQVVKYQSADFQGKSPTVMVVGAGTMRSQFTVIGLKAKFYFGVHVFVLHADPDSGWTEEDAEDAIDQVEFEIAQVFEANQKNQYWEAIQWEETSIVDRIVVSGDPFLYEVIPISVEVFK
jgi:hypothetical protein